MPNLVQCHGMGWPLVERSQYRVNVCVGVRHGPTLMTGIAPLSALERADTVIVPNRPDTMAPYDRDTLDAISRAHARGARMIGMCTGAFTLAAAGVLDRRRATVHWQWAEEFRARYPLVHLDDAVLFVDDGDILTSAGSAAALDLALHVVRRDHGAEIAHAFAVRQGSRRLSTASHSERDLPPERPWRSRQVGAEANGPRRCDTARCPRSGEPEDAQQSARPRHQSGGSGACSIVATLCPIRVTTMTSWLILLRAREIRPVKTAGSSGEGVRICPSAQTRTCPGAASTRATVTCQNLPTASMETCWSMVGASAEDPGASTSIWLLGNEGVRKAGSRRWVACS